MRAAIVAIPYEVFWQHLLSLDGRKRLRVSGLPANCRIVAIRDGFEDQTLCVRVEGPNLPLVQRGEATPRLEVKWELIDWPTNVFDRADPPELTVEQVAAMEKELDDSGGPIRLIAMCRRLLTEVGALHRQEERWRGLLSDRVQDSDLTRWAVERERRRTEQLTSAIMQAVARVNRFYGAEVNVATQEVRELAALLREEGPR